VHWDGVGLAESGGRDKLFAEMLGVHATKLRELIPNICYPLLRQKAEVNRFINSQAAKSTTMRLILFGPAWNFMHFEKTKLVNASKT
jgi:hypothetical protein